MTRERKIAYLSLLGNTLLWGLAIPIVKRGFHDGLAPTTFLLGRYFLALLFSLPYTLFFLFKRTIQKELDLKTLGIAVLMEALGTVAALWLLYEGVLRTTSVEASLIATTSPLFIILGGIIFLKEKEETHEISGLVMALIGTLLLIIKPVLNSGIDGNLIGNLLVLGQNLAITFYYLLAKRLYKGLNKWLVTHLSFWVGLIGFSGIIALSGKSPSQELLLVTTIPSLWPLIAIFYMAIAGSILGLTLYLIGQDKIEASEASLFTYLQPLFALPASVLLLHEKVSYLEISGIIMVAAGVFIAERRQKTN